MSLDPCVPNKRLLPSGPEPSPGLVTLECWRSGTHTARYSQVHGPQVLPGWNLALLPGAEKHSRYFSPISMSPQHKSHFGTTRIAKSTHLVILTLSGKTENPMRSRDMPHTALPTSSGHLSQSGLSASQHLKVPSPPQNNELLNFGPWMRRWGRVGNGPVASRRTSATEFTSQTQGALSE